jgi:dihydrofolate reductase
MIVTIIPILLGEGSPLFSKLSEELEFECIATKIYLNKIVQNHFRRMKE